jgi:hypothetical protein
MLRQSVEKKEYNMSFNLSTLWKSHPVESGTEHCQQDPEQQRRSGYCPSDMAFLDEEEIKRLAVLHHKPGTN